MKKNELKKKCRKWSEVIRILTIFLNLLSILGAIFILFWGLGGIFPLSYYRLFGLIGGIFLFICSIILIKYPNLILPRHSSILKEKIFEDIVLYNQKLFVIIVIIWSFIVMLSNPSDISIGLFGLLFGMYGITITTICLTKISSLKESDIYIPKIVKLKLYLVLILSFCFVIAGLILIFDVINYLLCWL